MGYAQRRIQKRRAARKTIDELMDRPDRVLVIHYSCEGFYDRPDGSSPRITSIAVRHLATGQTQSFSIHQMAEREHTVVAGNYDALERKMLDEFYEYVRRHPDCSWVHWNMRDVNYGFQAIEHRYRVLGGLPHSISDERRVDLSRLMKDMFGADYISHPHLEKLMQLNCISSGSFLSGAGEAEAFETGEYVKLHQSTLRKVYVIAAIAEMTDNRTLKTEATWRASYGLHPQAVAEWLSENWLVTVVGFASSVVGLGLFIYGVVRWIVALL